MSAFFKDIFDVIRVIFRSSPSKRKIKKLVEKRQAKTINPNDIKFEYLPINSISINNYYGINKINIKLPPDAPWIFLTGENGYGKTNVLQAIARALSHSSDNVKYEAIKPLQKKCSIALKVNGKKYSIKNESKGDASIDLTKSEFRILPSIRN